MECPENEISAEYRPYYRWFKGWKYEVKAYNNGGQLNVKDKDGVIQSFYPKNKTIVLHAANDRNDRRIYSETSRSFADFIHLLNNPHIRQKLIEGKYNGKQKV